MFEYLFIALIYVPASNTIAIKERLSSLQECEEVGGAYKAMEENTDYSCIKVRITK